jgi:hypothetical protein
MTLVPCVSVPVTANVRHVGGGGVLFAVENPALYFVRCIVCLAVIITEACITVNQDQRARLHGVINLWFSVQKVLLTSVQFANCKEWSLC